MTRPARETEVCPRPAGGGVFAPALGGGSGANRIAGDPEENLHCATQAGRPGAARDASVPGKGMHR